MDFFAHIIWSIIIFHKTPYTGLVVFFGVLPDLFSWTIYMFYSLFKRKKFRSPNPSDLPNWVHLLYGITHSIFVFAWVGLIILIILGYIPIFFWAWLIHILLDIPTHSRDFLPTPFLWPVSKWKFPGINWGNKWFMIANYTAIIVVGLTIFL